MKTPLLGNLKGWNTEPLDLETCMFLRQFLGDPGVLL